MTPDSTFAERVERIAPWAAGALLAAPVLVAYYPPMTDLPFHEAAIGILRHFGNGAMFPPGLYRHNLGEPNQLFHLAGWGLSYIVSSRWAVKLVVAASVVAIPVCAARFARHVGASPLAALVVAPMALGWLFSWGLVANLIGLAALLWTLPPLDRFEAEPTPRGALSASFGNLVLLYLAHEAMLMVYAGTALALAVLRGGPFRKMAWRLSPFAMGIVFTVAQAWWQKRFMTPAVRSMPTFWHPIGHKLMRVPYIILPATDRPVQLGMLALCALVVLTFFWLRAREPGAVGDPAPSRFERIRSGLLAHRWEFIAATCFAAYLAFPLTLHGATLVYQRWFPPAFAILVVTAAPRDLWVRAGRAARFGAFVLPLATILVSWPSFSDSGRQYRALDRLIPLVEPGSAVAEIDLGPGDPSRTYSLGPAAGRVLAARGGRLAYAFTDSSVSPVVIPRKYQWNESLIRIGFDSWSFRPQLDLRRFRYVLVRTTDPGLMWLATYALKPETDYITENGEWVLLQSKFPTAPLTSGEHWVEGPPSESVRDRINGLVATLRAAPSVAVPPEPGQDVGATGEGAEPL
jgi:hypothetical protein